MPQSHPPPRTPLGSAGPGGSPPAAPWHYDYLFPVLHRSHAWKPAGRTPDEQLANLRTRAAAIFGAPQVEGTLPAALTFLGQFIAHDLSFDARTDLTHPRGKPIRTHRSPRFDLDSVYGGGPRRDPHLYETRDPRRLAVGRNRNGEPDLPRSDDSALDHNATTAMNLRRTALIADPRNDENTIVSQLHLAFLRFHNRLVAEHRDWSLEQARQEARLHYQWILRHEYLSALCGDDLLRRVEAASGAQRIFPPEQRAFIPFEFAFAVFRFGHSMIGASYHLSDALERELRGFPLALYLDEGPSWRDRDRAAGGSLDGMRALPPRWTVQWNRFVEDDGTARLQRSQQIGAALSPALRFLPMPGVEHPIERTLAYRTLLRGWHLGLPSGQTVAHHVLANPNWNEGVPGGVLDPEAPEGDPLWLYVLREAASAPGRAAGRGDRLGRIGARLLAEVWTRLMQEDPESLLGPRQRGWTPSLTNGGTFGLREFLAYAEMPINAADWRRVVGGP